MIEGNSRRREITCDLGQHNGSHRNFLVASIVGRYRERSDGLRGYWKRTWQYQRCMPLVVCEEDERVALVTQRWKTMRMPSHLCLSRKTTECSHTDTSGHQKEVSLETVGDVRGDHWGFRWFTVVHNGRCRIWMDSLVNGQLTLYEEKCVVDLDNNNID